MNVMQNVIGVEHNQFKNFARFSEVELRVTCETMVKLIFKRLLNKFKEMVILFKKLTNLINRLGGFLFSMR